ncbi:histidinol-phosphatase HisJ [Bacillus taeanensis]|uniref:Histidinol-phosphatase n=1 Tax=Bacillus taeanensis TaxID=273032 RepID=A0A366Y4Z4_9BACI|nr:histidinol-phosphatase HisJ [Bacillus taeanensis]RBW71454.1 histidinol-phosphatase [Bacillus taeanensis]
MIFDGHIHTPFCPHGTTDTFEMYIEKALSLGLKGITFTEHAPLPEGFEDPTPLKDSAMNLKDLSSYFETIEYLKEKYKKKIAIHAGLEVDYLIGFEEETKAFLNNWGKHLDDAILSVHFLPLNNQYYCLDYSEETFAEMIEKVGSAENIYRLYFSIVKKSIHADLGSYKPKRIGHITLVHKFKKQFPVSNYFEEQLIDLLTEIKAANYQLDYNGAGFVKPLCGDSYPSAWIVNEALKRKIPLIYGSDAHSAKGLGQGYNKLYLPHFAARPNL